MRGHVHTGEADKGIASYETSVSDRMWHLRLTSTTPATVLETLLITLGTADAWESALGSPVTEKTVTTATRPLTDAGWKHKVADGRWIRWEASDGAAGIQFDTSAPLLADLTIADETGRRTPTIPDPTPRRPPPHRPAEPAEHSITRRTPPTTASVQPASSAEYPAPANHASLSAA
ncbi:hypothetical protein [Streptomyces sp. NPDC102462]|uniref:hypothetical protein n=1 Tax=Streptomyces sp. NPDC102462 TaxID=3366178 RepID=UPI0038234DD4